MVVVEMVVVAEMVGGGDGGDGGGGELNTRVQGLVSLLLVT